MSSLEEFRERYNRSLEAFIRGDPEPQKSLWSRKADITLANPLGPPAKGPKQVFEAMDRAAALTRDGEGLTYDVISSYQSGDLAYELAIQGGRMRLGDSSEATAVSLRVTSVVRREDDGWKLLHRHADPITAPRSHASLAQSTGAPGS